MKRFMLDFFKVTCYRELVARGQVTLKTHNTLIIKRPAQQLAGN